MRAAYETRLAFEKKTLENGWLAAVGKSVVVITTCCNREFEASAVPLPFWVEARPSGRGARLSSLAKDGP
jgi:hypothetical protein